MSGNNQPQVALDFDLTLENDALACMTVAMSLAKNALPFTVERLRACGWKGKNILDLRGVDDNFVTLDVFVQKDLQGRDRLRAEIVTGGGAMTFKMKTPIPVGRLDAFAAYVMRGIEAMPPPKTAVATSGEEVAPGEPVNDEIPF